MTAIPRKKPCPICRQPRVDQFFPFCSRGCRDRDLNQWFGDGYSVPGRAAAPEEIVPDDPSPDG